MKKTQIKKMRYLVKMRFKSLILDAIQLPLRSRLRLCRILIFKNLKLIKLEQEKTK